MMSTKRVRFVTDYTLQPIPGKTLSRRLPEGTALVLEGGGPVSYTHLDVYKRQRHGRSVEPEAR